MQDNTQEVKSSFKLKVPHTYTIIATLLLLMATFTWIFPSGEFEKKEVDGRMTVVPGTYEYVESNPQGITDVFLAPLKGFIDSAEIIGFILLVGGSFAIVNKTGAVEAGIGAIIKKLKGKDIIIIPISITLFALAGSMLGMSEEFIPFYMIFVPLMCSLGYDSLTGISIVYLGCSVGFIASTTNPFTVGVAQALSELTPGSGIGFRGIIFFILTSITIAFVMRHAKKVKLNPKKSIVYDIDMKNKENLMIDFNNIPKLTRRKIIVIMIYIIGMAAIIFGILNKGWYIPEIAMSFTIIGVASGIVGGLKEDEIAESFIDGIKDLATAAFVVGFARGIVLIAQDGKIIDTVLNSCAYLLQGLPKFIFINLTMLIEGSLGFLIGSASGTAALSIPVLAPLSDLVGVSRQMIVTAYHIGLGTVDVITPISGVLLSALAVGKVPWTKWFKYALPYTCILLIVSSIILTIGVYFI